MIVTHLLFVTKLLNCNEMVLGERGNLASTKLVG